MLALVNTDLGLYININMYIFGMKLNRHKNKCFCESQRMGRWERNVNGTCVSDRYSSSLFGIFSHMKFGSLS